MFLDRWHRIQSDLRDMYMMDWRRMALYEMCRRVWKPLIDTKPTMVENALWKVRTCEALTQLD